MAFSRLHVLIFSQSTPIGTLSNPKVLKTYDGTDMDADAYEIHRLFKDVLPVDADIHLHNNRKRQEIETIISEITIKHGENPTYYSRYGAFVFAFLTYRSRNLPGMRFDDYEDRIDCYDQPLTMEDIYKMVKEKQPFIGKPKIFIVQADNIRLLYPGEVTKGPEPVLPNAITRRIPSDVDRILLWSTLPQKLAYLDQDNVGFTESRIQRSQTGNVVTTASADPGERPEGSFLIQAMFEVLSYAYNHKPDTHLLTQTAWINRRVKALAEEVKTKYDKFKDSDLPLPVITSTLRKPFRFWEIRSEEAMDQS